MTNNIEKIRESLTSYGIRDVEEINMELISTNLNIDRCFNYMFYNTSSNCNYIV